MLATASHTYGAVHVLSTKSARQPCNVFVWRTALWRVAMGDRLRVDLGSDPLTDGTLVTTQPASAKLSDNPNLHSYERAR